MAISTRKSGLLSGVLSFAIFAVDVASAGVESCPTINFITQADVWWSIRSVNFVCDPTVDPAHCNVISGDTPFSFFWEYDSTGNGDWTAVPDTSGTIYFQGNAVGQASGGHGVTVDAFANFAVDLYLRIPTRLTVTNECGSDTKYARLWFCQANFDGEPGLDMFDYEAFVTAFMTNVPVADYNRDGVIDCFDYLDFVDALAAGCP